MIQQIFIFQARHAISFFSLLLLFVYAVPATYAQDNVPQLYREVQLNRKSYTLYELTREIQQQTGFTFSYNASRINPSKKIKVRSERLTVHNILAHIKKQSGLGVKVIGQKHIIYTQPKPARKLAAKKEKTAKKKQVALNKSRIKETKETAAIINPAMEQEQHVVVIGDSAVASAFYSSGGAQYEGGYPGKSQALKPVVVHYNQKRWEDPYAQLDGSLYKNYGAGLFSFLQEKALFDIGFSVNELNYFNPQICLGFQFLYGVISYQVGKNAHLRYGLGASAKINDQWNMHAQVTTGKAAPLSFTATTIDTIPGPPPEDSLAEPDPPILVPRNTPFTVHSRLDRLEIFIARRIGRRFYVGAGITFNHLYTQYLAEGSLVSLDAILPPGTDIEGQYRSIAPLYSLSNTYGVNRTTNTKIWFGISLSCVYRLPFSRSGN